MKKKILNNKNNHKVDKTQFPEYCDYSCEHAEFGSPDAVGACRRDQGVWCKFFKRYNNKLSVCIAKK